MRVACLLIDHFAVRLLLERDPTLCESLIVMTGVNSRSKHVVVDVFPDSPQIAVGMPVDMAIDTSRGASFFEIDDWGCRRRFDIIIESVEALGLEVEDAGFGLAYISISGLDLLLGSEQSVLDAILGVLPSHMFPRVGIGDSKFAALIAAYQAVYGSALVTCSGHNFLHSLSAGLLPISPQMKERLYGFGLHTIGQIAAIPVGPLQAQFGNEGRRAWELSRGIDRDVFVPRQREEMIDISFVLEPPTVTTSVLAVAAQGLLGKALSQPNMRGKSARICILEGVIANSPAWHRRLVFREPISDSLTAMKLIRHAIESNPPIGPLEELRLMLKGITGESGLQQSLFAEVRQQGNLRESIKQLQARLADDPLLYQVRELEPCSRIPERRWVLTPFDL